MAAWKGLLFGVVVVLSSRAACAAAPASRGDENNRLRVSNFELSDFRGKSHALADFSDRKLLVVAFIGTECPLAKIYGARLAELAGEYADRGVAIVGIDSNRQDSITELAAFARRHKIDFPLLKDAGNRVADQFGARRTPEVFVLDSQRVVRYRGRIDDQYGIGFVRDEPLRRDLKLALDELLADKDVTVAVTEAAGCLIGRVREPKTDGTVTYSKQIARILQQRCVECHRPGEIAPFALTQYDEVVGWAEMIAEVVEQNRMPPWHADPKHGTFADDRRLGDEERRLIAQWVRDGAPQGDPSQLPPPREFLPSGWQLPREPDVVVPMSAQAFAVPAQGTIRYQFFSADPKFTEDKWVAAAEVRPGNRAVVHHVLVFAGGRGERLADEAGSFLAAYVPGLRAKPYPAGMAKRIPAGSRITFQVHYTPNGSPQMDISELGLVFADPDRVKYEVRTTSAVSRTLDIPPGDDNYQVEATSGRAPDGALLLAMMPHMHLRGKAFRYELVLPDGREQTLLDVPRYDFNWQTAYRLAEPMPLPAGTRMHCIAHFDNSADNPNNPDPTRTVHWGSQTWDEMMIGYFDLAFARDATAPLSPGKGLKNRFDGERLVKLLDRNGDGQVDRDEVPERLRDAYDRLVDRGAVRISVEKLIERLRNR